MSRVLPTMVHDAPGAPVDGVPFDDQSGIDHAIRQAMNRQIFNVQGSGRPRVRLEYVEVVPETEAEKLRQCNMEFAQTNTIQAAEIAKLKAAIMAISKAPIYELGLVGAGISIELIAAVVAARMLVKP